MRTPVITRSARRAVLLLAALGVFAVGGGAAWALGVLPVAAAVGPPAPTMTSHPSAVVSGSRVVFTFKGRDAVGYECRLDAGEWSACASPKVITGLEAGPHVFSVRSVDAEGRRSAVAPFWAFVVMGPAAPTITSHPPLVTGSSTITFGFRGEPGVGFECKMDLEAWTPCTSPTDYPRLEAGAHVFSVRAVNAAGVRSALAPVWAFTVTGPKEPTITSHPGLSTRAWKATFAFTGPGDAGFECRMDEGAWSSCTSPTSYTGLSEGRHVFTVRSVNAAGRRSVLAPFWSFTQTTSSGSPFSISGDATGLLAPGAAASPVAVKLTNPNDQAIEVDGLTVALTGAGLPAGCDPAWFAITQSDLSPDTPVRVPANGSVTLPAQGVSAPTIALRESGTNQDACKNARLSLEFTGSAHS